MTDEPPTMITLDDEPAVIRAVEENLAASHLASAQRLGFTWQVNEETVWTLSDSNLPPHSTIIRTRWPDESAEALAARIAATLAPYRAAGRAALWWRWPSSRPAALGAALLAAGLTYRGEGPGMAADLRALPRLADLTLPQALTVEEVGDPAAIREWTQVEMIVYRGEGTSPTEEYVARELRLGWGADLPYRRWLARLAGQPVGTASIFLGVGVAGLYNVTTIPAARRQGVGAALTIAALAAGRDAGYRVGVLQASPLGLPVYQRLGFREVCRIQSYMWEPPHDV